MTTQETLKIYIFPLEFEENVNERNSKLRLTHVHRNRGEKKKGRRSDEVMYPS